MKTNIDVQHEMPDGKLLSMIPSDGIVATDNFADIGVHSLYAQDKLLHSIVVNANPKELENLLSLKEIEEKMGIDCYFLNNDQEILSSIVNAREGYELWRYFLWLICIMIIIEMLISNVNKET